MADKKANAALKLMEAIDAERRGLAGERYQQTEVLLTGVTGTLETTNFGTKALVAEIDGETKRIPLHRSADEKAKSFDIAVFTAPKEFKYKDNAENIVVVPAGTRKYVAL